MSRIDELIAQHCPDGVTYKQLSDLASTVPGLTGKTKADFSGGNARFATYRNIFANPSLDLEASDFVKIKEGERQNSVQLGDILVTGSSESLDEVGMSSVVTSSPAEPIYLNSFCFIVRPHMNDILDPDFSKHLFRSEPIRKQIRGTASGVTRINISKSRFMKVTIPVPPIEVQCAIVEVLDTFSKLEAELEAELEARKQQYEHYQSQLLFFGEGEAEWLTLGDIGRVAMCKRIFKDETAPSGDIPFFKIGTFGGKPDAFISRELYDEYRNRFSFPSRGDILLSAAGTIGRAIPYDGEPAYFQDSNIVWLAHDESVVLNSYLRYWYRVVKWTTDGGTIRRLYNENLRKAKIAVPPLEEQHRIVEILDKFDALVNDLNVGLPAELATRRQQYEYYRDKLLTFKELEVAA